MADKVISVEITGDASGLVSAAQSARGALSGLSGAQDDAATAAGRNTESTKENTKATEENSKKQKNAAQRMTESGKKWKEVGEGIDQVTKPLQYASVAVGAMGVASAKTAIDFEDNFANVKKTVEGTPEQLDKIKQGIIDLTTKGINGHSALPQTTAELTELAAAGGQLGIATENILDFTETMAQMGTATNLSGEDGAATLARFMNVTNTSQENVSNLGSAIVDLGNNFATTESEIANLALRMGETGGVVGISAQDILGYSTALSSMGIEAEAGGSAVSRIWMTMQKVVAGGGDELKAFAKVSGKSSAEFKKQWKEDASKAFQDFIKGLSKSEDQISLLDELGFGNIRDIAALQALASTKGIDLMTDALERSNEAWEENTALQTEADAKAQTTAGQMQIAKNNITETARSLGEVMLPSIVDVTSGISNFTQKLAGMNDAQKKAVVTGAAVTVGMGVLAKGAAGAIKTVGSIKEGLGKLGVEVPTIKKIGSSIISGITSPAGIAALAVAGIGAAGVAAYKSWYNSKYKWGEDLAEIAGKAAESYEKVKSLGELRKEVQQLDKVIVSSDSSSDEVSQAQQRLREIAQLVKDEYGITVTADSSQLDAALAKLEKIKLNEARANQSTLNQNLSKDSKSYQDSLDELSGLQAKFDKETALSTPINNALASIQRLHDAYRNDPRSTDIGEGHDDLVKEYKASVKDALKEYGIKPKDIGFNGYDRAGNETNNIDDWTEKTITDFLTALAEKSEELNKDLDEKNENSTAGKLKILQESIDSFEDRRKELVGNALTELEFGDRTTAIKDLTAAVKDYYASAEETAMSAVKAEHSMESFSELAGDSEKIDNAVQSYQNYAKTFDASAEEIAQGSALIANGFDSVENAAIAGDDAINNVITDLQKYGEQNGLFDGMDSGGIAAKLTEMAHAMDLLPDTKHIEIDAEGNTNVIDEVQQKINELNDEGKIKLSINADGNVDVLDTTDSKLKNLAKSGAIDIKFNVDTGGFDINDLGTGSKLGEITADGTVVWHVDSTEVDNCEPDNKPANVTYTPDFTQIPEQGPALTGIITYTPVITGKPEATGTDYFSGGLAMVNDQKGIADPRELIIDKGRAFIPEGKDVVLPLSKGAKVYTAAQTKRIMAGIGIPHYASGKNNSDAFTNAVNDYSHYTATHAVSITEQLEKWNQLLKETAQNDKDVADAEEKIYSLRQKQYQEQLSHSKSWLAHEQKYNALSYDDTVAAIRRIEARVQEAYNSGLIAEREYLDTMREWDEKYLDEYISMQKKLRSESESYISLHATRNDWDAISDDPISAYNRVKDREKDLLNQGLEDWDTYYSNLNSLSEGMLDDRISQSEEWLSMQKQYYSMNTSEYIAGLDRMLDYTNEYYDKLEISDKKYTEVTQKLAKERMDAQRQLYADWQKSADNYYKIRETFDDWEEAGDSKSQFYLRSIAQVEKHYRDGNLSWQDYMDESMEKYLSMYEAVSEEYADKLQDISDEMDEVSKKYATLRSDLTKEHDQKTRDKDLAEVNRLLDIYENAVTDAGQQKYKDLLEQKDQLLYQQKLADLEEDEQAALDNLQDSYDTIEAEKARTLSALRTDSFNIFGKVSDMNIDTSDIKALAETVKNTVISDALTNARELSNSDTIVTIVRQIASQMSKFTGATGTSNTYNNNGIYHIASDAAAQKMIEELTGTIVSGLGAVMIG
ncbi:MAG: phage tail tape measure protein [Oscillospiraceae bacterium]|nr:phage tail tape measure protein [Oscillospiraceae bacterium]